MQKEKEDRVRYSETKYRVRGTRLDRSISKLHDYYKPCMLDPWIGWSKMQIKGDKIRYSKTKDRVTRVWCMNKVE